MDSSAWWCEFPGVITVCDREGIILEMNQRALEIFKEDGGAALYGQNLLDCHPGPARQKLEQMMAGAQANIYTIEKKGRKQLIYQAPWYKDGEYAGFVELELDIPLELPHFIRQE